MEPAFFVEKQGHRRRSMTKPMTLWRNSFREIRRSARCLGWATGVLLALLCFTTAGFGASFALSAMCSSDESPGEADAEVKLPDGFSKRFRFRALRLKPVKSVGLAVADSSCHPRRSYLPPVSVVPCPPGAGISLRC